MGRRKKEMDDVKSTNTSFNISPEFADIIPHLDRQYNKSRYICQLIQDDMNGASKLDKIISMLERMRSESDDLF